MYNRKQLQVRSGLNARQLRTRLEALNIKPNERGIYYAEHLQLIMMYRPVKPNYFEVIESKLNFINYEKDLEFLFTSYINATLDSSGSV